MMGRFAVVSISDSRSKKPELDEAGKLLKTMIADIGSVTYYNCIPDDFMTIRDTLMNIVKSKSADIIITTGGTGVAPRDVTPDVTLGIIEKRLHGVEQAVMGHSLSKTKFAMLSRAVAGVVGDVAIINFPGSKKAVKECFEVVAPICSHLVDLLKNDSELIADAHTAIQGLHHDCPHQKSLPVNIPRITPFSRVTVKNAIEYVLTDAEPLQVLRLPVLDSNGFFIAADVKATLNIPPFPASIKDGYACNFPSTAQCPISLEVLNAGSFCGASKSELPHVGGFQACYVNTGAPIPDGADRVVQVEDTEVVQRDSNGVEISLNVIKGDGSSYPAGNDIRPIGSDISIGQVVARSHQYITPAAVGTILSAVANAQISVYDWPLIGILSTGNELVSLQHLTTSSFDRNCQIVDVNGPTLLCLLRRLYPPSIANEKVVLCDEPLRDDVDSVEAGLRRCFERFDVVVTTGGVSMGIADKLRDVLIDKLGQNGGVDSGQPYFGQVHMKPGKPTQVWRICGSWRCRRLFALPGNPVSAFVTAVLYVLPYVRRVAGEAVDTPTHRIVPVRTCERFRLDLRPEFHRCIWHGQGLSDLKEDVHTIPVVKSTSLNKHASSTMMSAAFADCLLMLPAKSEEKEVVEPGEVLNAILLPFSRL